MEEKLTVRLFCFETTEQLFFTLLFPFHWRKAPVISINKNWYSTDIWVLLVLLVYDFLLRR